jgi:hypothetical protein
MSEPEEPEGTDEETTDAAEETAEDDAADMSPRPREANRTHSHAGMGALRFS